MKKVVFFMMAIALALQFNINAQAAVFKDVKPNSTKAVWRILWLICPKTDVKVDGIGRIKGTMSKAEIEAAEQIAIYFENFVEKAAGGALDVKIDVVKSEYPLDFLAQDETIKGKKVVIPDMDAFKKGKSSKYMFYQNGAAKYDSIVSYGNIDEKYIYYDAFNNGWLAFMPTNRTNANSKPIDISSKTDQSKFDLLFSVIRCVHESLHYIQWSAGFRHEVPRLHDSLLIDGDENADWAYCYTDNNILNDKSRKASDFSFFEGTDAYIKDIRKLKQAQVPLWEAGKTPLDEIMWLSDYIGGCIRPSYSKTTTGTVYLQDGSSEFRKGMAKNWWLSEVTKEFSGTKIALRSYMNNKYISADAQENSSSPPLLANRETPLDWETFEVTVKNGAAYFKSLTNQKYLAVNKDNSISATASSTKASGFQIYTADGYYYIKSLETQQYITVRLDLTPPTRVEASGTLPREWERFSIAQMLDN